VGAGTRPWALWWLVAHCVPWARLLVGFCAADHDDLLILWGSCCEGPMLLRMGTGGRCRGTAATRRRMLGANGSRYGSESGPGCAPDCGPDCAPDCASIGGAV